MDKIQETSVATSSPSPTQGLKQNTKTQKKPNNKPNKTPNKTPTKKPKQSKKTDQNHAKKRNERFMPSHRELVADLISLTEDYGLALGEYQGEKLVFWRLPAIPSEGEPIQGNSLGSRWSPIDGKISEEHLMRISQRQLDRGPTKEVVGEVLRHVEARGLSETPRPMYRRHGFHQGKIYIDLGCDQGQTVVVDPSNPAGYCIDLDPPVLFRRTQFTGELPQPKTGGSREMFANYFPNLLDQGVDALLGLLVSCYSQGSFPTTFMTGPEGSGKSVGQDLIRSMIDPLKSGGGRSTLPSKIEDLMTVVGSGGFLATFDNASRISPEISDALCQISTGGNMPTRKLYAQGVVHNIFVKNPVFVTSIALPHDKPDLLSRSVILEFHPLKDLNKPESFVKDQFAKDLPCLLGYLFSAIARALRDANTTNVSPTSRLSETEKFVTAAEPLLGCGDGKIVSAWNVSRANAAGELEGSDPVIAILEERLKAIGSSISGTTTELMSKFESKAVNEKSKLPPDFPKTAQQLGIHLKRNATLLKAAGFEVTDLPRTRHGSSKTITRVGLSPAPAWQVTVVRPIQPPIMPTARVLPTIHPSIPLPAVKLDTAA